MSSSLRRLWQACHQPNKINKKAVEEFDYASSFEAIIEPDQNRVYPPQNPHPPQNPLQRR